MHYSQPPYQRFNSSTHLDRGPVSEIVEGRVGQLAASHKKAIEALKAMKEYLRARQSYTQNWAPTINFLGAAVASNHELNMAHQLSAKVPDDGTLHLHDVVSAEVNVGYVSDIAQTDSETGNDQLAAAYESLNKAQNSSAKEVNNQIPHGSEVPLYYEPLDSDTIGSRQ